MTASPLEARCEHCHDTGSLSQHMDGPLDCHYCEAANQRIAMRNHIAQLTGWPNNDTGAWAAYLFAQRQSAPVAIPQEIHCQDFHELAMDYRSAGSVFDAHGPQKAYERLCAYINARLAPVAAQPAMPKLPSTPEEVVAFIGDHFTLLYDMCQVKDHEYTLTVHDLLSCFQNLADFSGEAAQPVEVAGQVPDGYLLVPKSPNEEMLRPDGFTHRLAYSQYQAMLAAAPQPAAQPSDDVARVELMELLDSVLGNCYMGNDWELERATDLKNALMAKEKA